jgi:hypothetical protein
MAHQRFAADDREVKRALAIDEREHPVDQFLALEIANLTKGEIAAEMIVAVGVAAGTTQRTLAGDFDGKGRSIAREDPTPGWENPFHLTTIAAVC